MVKDYYYSSYIRPGVSFLFPSTVKAIDDILLSQACFSTYARFRGYVKRVQSDCKVFLWKGWYYELTDECRNKIICLIDRDRKNYEVI